MGRTMRRDGLRRIGVLITQPKGQLYYWSSHGMARYPDARGCLHTSANAINKRKWSWRPLRATGFLNCWYILSFDHGAGGHASPRGCRDARPTVYGFVVREGVKPSTYIRL